MFANERREQIIQLLNQRSSVKVAELTDMFQVSLETIRKDLEFLERQGALKRVHGGALSMRKMQNYTPFPERQEVHREDKMEISRLALNYIHEGERIALDTGTTAREFALMLCRSFHSLTIVTASLPVFEILSGNPGFKVILAGGFYDPDEKFFCGHLTLDMIRQIHVSSFFLMPSALSLDFGISEHVGGMIEVQREMIKIADQVIVLADSSKFETCAGLKICDVNPRFTYLTDSGLDEEIREAYRKASLHVINEKRQSGNDSGTSGTK